MPIINIYYDLSFGKKPHILLIIDGPNSAPHNIMENPIRWLGPKPAPYNIDENPPELFDEFIMSFLPSSLTVKQLNEEKQLIYNFIKELNQLRRKYIPKDFTNSNIVNDITMLQKSYSYVSTVHSSFVRMSLISSKFNSKGYLSPQPSTTDLRSRMISRTITVELNFGGWQGCRMSINVIRMR